MSEADSKYANRHIPSFLQIPEALTSDVLQVVEDGSQLTAANILSDTLNLREPILVTDTPKSIGMKLPKKVAGIADLAPFIPPSTPVRVIDVRIQQELENWTFADLVDYFEDEDRFRGSHAAESASSPSRRPRRVAAQKCLEKTGPAVLNQISLEFSPFELRKRVLSPQFVRDLDWIDNVWPLSLKKQGQFPSVQYYFLTSSAGCFTDFHIDFGGTSVWYHILTGSKEFCLIEPTKENCGIYEEWLCSKDQAGTFLADKVPNKKGVFRVCLRQGQTLIIPSGWIHSVYTPVDSLVFGGNFLHGLSIDMQIKGHCIEVRSKVLEQYRFPHFLELHFYAAGYYIRKIRNHQITRSVSKDLYLLSDVLENWWPGHEADPFSPVHKAALKVASDIGHESFGGALAELKEYAQKERFSNTSDITTKERPRLKLKLSSPTAQKAEKKTPAATSSGFKIKLKTSSKRSIPMRPRESADLLVGEAETLPSDEWIPHPASSDAWEPEVAKQSKNRKPVNYASQGSVKRKKKAVTTARERLLKKAKW